MKKLLLVVSTAVLPIAVFGQQENNAANITGNVESIFQYLLEDQTIGANQPDQISLLNSYMNVFYTQGNFKAGLRMESYLPSIQGYPVNFNGTGIGMRYVGYENDFVDVTMGSFYEQFGSGLAFRAYEDRTLGYDNMMDGARLILRPLTGVTIKGVYGYQREEFNNRIEHGDGIVRGVDGEINLNQAIKALKDKKLNVAIGGSLVSKYQSEDIDSIILPENVGAYGGRLKLRYGKYTLDGEYIFKGQDPSEDQYDAYGRVIYNNGHAAVINFGYSQKGLGILLSAKSVDNMSYRSDRTAKLQNLLINYLPAMNKVHTYNLVSSLYPWATQPLGEIAYQGEVLYTIKRGSKLGGKYGTSINLNGSFAMSPKRDLSNYVPGDTTGIYYESGVFSHSDLSDFSYITNPSEVHYDTTKYYNNPNFFWQDINVSIYRKFSKKFNLKLSYFNMMMNNDVNKVASFAKGVIRSQIGVIEVGYKINRKHSVRAELQGLLINKVYGYFEEITEAGDTLTYEGDVWNDKGNWITALVEYNFSPHWFFSIMDQYNLKSRESISEGKGTFSYYSTQGGKTGVHHVYVSAGYIRGATRLTIGYGKQRAGLFCVGGICRNVPASYGLTMSFTHSF